MWFYHFVKTQEYFLTIIEVDFTVDNGWYGWGLGEGWAVVV